MLAKITAAAMLALTLGLTPLAHADTQELDTEGFSSVDRSRITPTADADAKAFIEQNRTLSEEEFWQEFDNLSLETKLAVTAELEDAAALAHPNAQTRSAYSRTVLSAAEIAQCGITLGASKCYKAKQLADHASDEAIRFYPTSSHNGRGDAWRHCWWSASMIIDLGENAAKLIGTNHEKFTTGPQAEKEMDLYNNAQGRWAAVAAGNDWRKAVNFCHTWSGNGILKTLN